MCIRAAFASIEFAIAFESLTALHCNSLLLLSASKIERCEMDTTCSTAQYHAFEYCVIRPAIDSLTKQIDIRCDHRQFSLRIQFALGQHSHRSNWQSISHHRRQCCNIERSVMHNTRCTSHISTLVKHAYIHHYFSDQRMQFRVD